MHSIQKISSALLWVFNLLLVVLPLFMIAQWGLIEWAPFRNLVAEGMFFKPIETPEGFVNLANIALTPLSKSIGLVGSLVGMLPVFWGIMILRQIFQNYQRGNIFSTENAKKYQYLGWLFFIDGILVQPLTGMLMVLTATLSNPVGHRYISLTFGTPNLETFFCGILIIVISKVMAEGSKLQEEQRLTI